MDEILHMLTPLQWLCVAVALGTLNAVLDLLGAKDQ